MGFGSFFSSGLKTAFPVVAGFGAGWGGWSFIDSQGWISDDQKRDLYLSQYRWRQSAAETLPEAIGRFIAPASHSTPQEEQQRVPFSEILRSCRVTEQCDWLMDHLSESIPYFYIHDLFASWATLHEQELTDPANQPNPYYGKTDDFSRSDVVEGIWYKTVNGVLPAATGIRCLALLSLNPDNAKWLDKNARYSKRTEEFKVQLEGNSEDGKVESPTETTRTRTIVEGFSQPAASNRRGDFARDFLKFVDEYHLENHDSSEGSSLVQERELHLPRATLDLLGNINAALIKEEASWWKRLLKQTKLRRVEDPQNLVLPTNWRSDAAITEAVNKLAASEVHVLFTSATAQAELPEKEKKTLLENGLDVDKLRQLHDSLFSRHKAWIDQLIAK